MPENAVGKLKETGLNVLSRKAINEAMDSGESSEALESLRREVLDLERQHLELICEALESDEFVELIDGGKITLGMIRPRLDRIGKHEGRSDDELADEIAAYTQERGLEVIAAVPVRLDKVSAEEFYGNLQEDLEKRKAFSGDGSVWESLTSLMSSGATTVMIMYYEDGAPDQGAVELWRDVIGGLDPKKAQPESVRGMFADDLGNNVVHGSDSIEAVKRETGWMAQRIQNILEQPGGVVELVEQGMD